jgi:hypothetical protein
MRIVVIEYHNVFKVLSKLTEVDIRVISTLRLLICVCVFSVLCFYQQIKC